MNSAAITVEPPFQWSASRAQVTGRLNRVAIYDGFEDGIRINEAFDWLNVTLGPDLEVRHCTLSFAMLGRLDIRAAAVHEASDANLLMVAAAADKPLPVQVSKWIERCFSENHQRPSAVVALHDELLVAPKESCELQTELHRICERWALRMINRLDQDHH